jgi:hypothetical protein
MTEAEALAETLDRARQYTLYYFNKLSSTDLHERIEVKGRRLNSAFWLLSHLTISENWLTLNGTGEEMERFSWAKLFSIGKEPPSADECPPVEEVMETASRVHEKAMERIRNLTAEELGAPHKVGFDVGGEGLVRDAIMHAIRHEAGHAGQLGSLCAMQGIKTI